MKKDGAAAYGYQIYSWGLVVNPTPYRGGTMFAEIVPSGSTGGKLWWRQFLPWVGRWWFEINVIGGEAEGTYAYEPGGSGGAFTLRSCVSKAMDAIEEYDEQE